MATSKKLESVHQHTFKESYPLESISPGVLTLGKLIDVRDAEQTVAQESFAEEMESYTYLSR